MTVMKRRVARLALIVATIGVITFAVTPSASALECHWCTEDFCGCFDIQPQGDCVLLNYNCECENQCFRECDWRCLQ